MGVVVTVVDVEGFVVGEGLRCGLEGEGEEGEENREGEKHLVEWVEVQRARWVRLREGDSGGTI